MANNGFIPNADLQALGELGERVKNLIPQLRNNYDISRNQTDALNPERKLNVAYYNGKMWSFWDDDTKEVKSNPPPNSDDSAPIVDNVLRTLLDTRIANLANATPNMEVVASTDEMADIAAANVANEAAKAMWHYLNLSDIHARGHKVAGMRYNCFAKVLFDPYAGDIDENGQPYGDIAIETVPPERVYVDPLADRVMPERKLASDARWLFEVCVQDVGFVLNHPTWSKGAREEPTAVGNKVIYGGVPSLDAITKHDSIAASQGEQAMGDVLDIDQRKAAQGVSTYAKKGDRDPKGGVVRILYYYEHKSPNYPQGRFAAFLPDNDWHVLEYRDELPYATPEHPTGLFPWVMYVDVFEPGKLTGVCRFTEARPLQDEINTEMTIWRQTLGAWPPMILADEDSGITAETIRGAGVATVFKYHSTIGGQPPTMQMPTAVAQESQLAMNNVMFLTRRCEDKMESHSVSYHPRNSATTLGEIEIMRLEDETRLKSNDVRRAEQTVYAPMMKLILRLMQRFYTEPRMLNFFGGDGKGSLKRFIGSEIHFKDVMIVPGTSMESSRALKVALGLRYMELTASTIRTPEDSKQFRLDMAQILDLQMTQAMTTDQLQAKKQRDECLRILDGERNILPGPFDDPATHCNEIVKFAIGPDVENLPQPKKNNVLQELIMHYKAHKDAGLNTFGSPDVGAATLAAEPGAEAGPGQPGQEAQPGQASPEAGAIPFGGGGMPEPVLPAASDITQPNGGTAQ